MLSFKGDHLNYMVLGCSEEIEFLLSCALSSDEDSLNYKDFTEQFHSPAADIGFNMAVLLTNLAEHMPKDER